HALSQSEAILLPSPSLPGAEPGVRSTSPPNGVHSTTGRSIAATVGNRDLRGGAEKPSGTKSVTCRRRKSLPPFLHAGIPPAGKNLTSPERQRRVPGAGAPGLCADFACRG